MQNSKRVFYVDKKQLREWSGLDLYLAGQFCMINILSYFHLETQVPYTLFLVG